MSKYYISPDNKVCRDGEPISFENLNEWQLRDICEVLQDGDLLDELRGDLENKESKIDKLEQKIERLEEEIEKLQNSTKESESADFIIKVLVGMLVKKTDAPDEEKQRCKDMLQLIEPDISGPDRNERHIKELRTHIENVSFFKPKQLLDLLCKL